MDDSFGAVLSGIKSSWTSTKLPSRRRRKRCELIDHTRSLLYLGVDVLMRGAPWFEPRLRMKQRVRAVCVRSELIRVLPPSQCGILVAGAVASLWIAGGASFGVRQLKPTSSKGWDVLSLEEFKCLLNYLWCCAADGTAALAREYTVCF